MHKSSVVFACDDDDLTAVPSCGVIGLRDRREVITTPSTQGTTLRCRPVKNLTIRYGERRSPAFESPVSPMAFHTHESQNLIIIPRLSLRPTTPQLVAAVKPSSSIPLLVASASLPKTTLDSYIFCSMRAYIVTQIQCTVQ